MTFALFVSIITVLLAIFLCFVSEKPQEEPVIINIVVSEQIWCMPKYQSREEMTGNNGNSESKEGQITLHYPMLTRNNYRVWAIKMRVFMQAQGVWEAVEPRTANTVVEVKKDKMALAAIYQGIPEDLLMPLAEKKSAKEA